MTAATRNTGARFRTRKLSTKQSLQIVYEDQIDAVDDEQRNIAQVETGVERSEEIVRVFCRPFFPLYIDYFFCHPKITCVYAHSPFPTPLLPRCSARSPGVCVCVCVCFWGVCVCFLRVCPSCRHHVLLPGVFYRGDLIWPSMLVLDCLSFLFV